jgi:16S rRNA (guanine(966)-N(2))-methyltransferase RsmD
LKEAIFNVLLHNVCYDFDNSFVIDLFAGSGSLGIESISAGSKKVLFVDSSKVAIECIKNNLLTLKIENFAHVVQKKAESIPDDFIIDFTKNTDNVLIFLDPPYDETEYLIKQISRLQKLFIGKTAVFVIESNQKIHLSNFSVLYYITHGKAFVNIAIL